MTILSRHAQAGKCIRQELKAVFPGFKFGVSSHVFAGGNSVSISWTDGPTYEQVEEITSKYQQGWFDLRTDCYEMSNIRKDIPQVKYVQVNRSISENFRKYAFDCLKMTRGDFEDLEWEKREYFGYNIWETIQRFISKCDFMHVEDAR